MKRRMHDSDLHELKRDLDTVVGAWDLVGMRELVLDELEARERESNAACGAMFDAGRELEEMAHGARVYDTLCDGCGRTFRINVPPRDHVREALAEVRNIIRKYIVPSCDAKSYEHCGSRFCVECDLRAFFRRYGMNAPKPEGGR